MISNPIFKRDSAGKVRTWQVEVEGDSYRTIAGIQGGNLVTSGWTKCEPKNEGRANATTAETQAQLEAKAEEGKKLKREYRRSLAEIDNVMKGPMLAKDYAKLKKPLTFPVFSQPKLDGIRAIITKDGAFSRELQPHYNCDHILAALKPVFDKYPDAVFDGEFYNHDLKDDFNKIVSIVRKQDPTAEHRAEAAKLLEYHIYDLPSEAALPFEDRYRKLVDVMIHAGPRDHIPLKLVLTFHHVDQESLDYSQGQFLEGGYEGQMVRLNEPYENSRSASLLKRKEFITEEFPIKRIEEGNGNWAGFAKRVVLHVPGAPARPQAGLAEDEVGAGMRGTQDFAKDVLTNAGRYKQSTVRHFGKTPDGSLRFPVVIDFHAEGRVD